jgi:methionyl-tRNA formyltransferase
MKYRYVFFGTPHIAELCLMALKDKDLLPALIVTAPARPQGRGMHIAETPVALFAHEHDIPVMTPEKITAEIITELQAQGPWDFFLVVAYGKILPVALLDIVDGKVLNVHPSLLPRYRGPSPLETVLLSDDTETGVTIMQLDKEVDHGPIVAQQSFTIPKEETITSLTEKSADVGAQLLSEYIATYVQGTHPCLEQDHSLATQTHKYTKADGQLTEDMSGWQKWKIFRALGERGWVHCAAFRHGETLSLKITKASYGDDAFVIEEVIPTNGKRQSYEDFLHSL